MKRIRRTTRDSSSEDMTGLWRPSFALIEDKMLLYAFGGGGVATTSMHILDLKIDVWNTLKTSGDPPSQRYGHTIVRYDNYLIVYGGCEYATPKFFCSDLHLFDLRTNTWSQPSIKGLIPVGRYLHTANVVKEKMIVYGGFAKKDDYTYVLEEFVVLDLSTWTWSTNYKATGRYNHSSVQIDDMIYVFSGKDKHGHTMLSLSCVDVDKMKESMMFLNGDSLMLKSRHFMTPIDSSRVVIFGKSQTKPKDSMYMERGLQPGLWLLDVNKLYLQRLDKNIFDREDMINYATRIGNQMILLGNMDKELAKPFDNFRDLITIDLEFLNVWVISPSQFTFDFKQLLQDETLSDFVIVGNDGSEIHVHKIILYARFPHFRRLYQSGMIEVLSSRMQIDEPREMIRMLVEYLYTDEFPNTDWDEIAELLRVADIYNMERLKKLCCHFLYDRINPQLAPVLFQQACRAHEDGLKFLVTQYISENYGRCIRYMDELPLNIRQEFYAHLPAETRLVRSVNEE